MRGGLSQHAARCPRCALPLRWCVCPAHREVTCPLAVDVLACPREHFRPSSTGNLIVRVLPEARQHLWYPDRPPTAAEVCRPGREVWLLHPSGEPAPAAARAQDVQVVLLDGAWSEASGMVRAVRGWGRLVSLPMQGESRYWLRAQADAHRFSTVEALLFVLRHFGLEPEAEALRLQFELHVYASLRARGAKAQARDFLAGSPIAATFAELIASLDVSRPR
ncbi:DTW domain-containing protein [Opitutus sp. ER46]|uniref:tRNA-uridine aminocarboxypropyltransferase n=1 Tax=Opitutus sp. ER46 TaxID=2161864 RepID=UPI000D3134A9|nr:DTW domain-containing protein [Opitutus sp. ER46]PTX92375.1 DTW domain-containing protein [Opitutus sp. ER46]